MLKHSRADAPTLREAADQLDALWELDAARGQRDSLGGCEYVRVSTAPRLREIADQLDPPLAELLREFRIDTFFLAQRIGCEHMDLVNWLHKGGELDDLTKAKLGIVYDTLRLVRGAAS